MVALTVDEVLVEAEIEPDAETVYCVVAERFSVTVGGFCENCGATDHDRH